MTAYKFTGKPIDKAYDYLRHLLRHGWEFPDACYKAAQREDVPYDSLVAFYDERTAA
jgi:hypothetical protein